MAALRPKLVVLIGRAATRKQTYSVPEATRRLAAAAQRCFHVEIVDQGPNEIRYKTHCVSSFSACADHRLKLHDERR